MQHAKPSIDLDQPGLIFSVYERLTGLSAFGYRCADGSRIVRCPAAGHEDRHPSCKLNPRINAWKCLAGETRVVTLNGVFPIADLVGPQILMTEHGKWVNAEIRNFGEQQLWEMCLSRNGRTKTLFATADHRWFVHRYGKRGFRREEVVTQNLKAGDPLSAIRTYGIGTTNLSQFGIAQGFTYGDGYVMRDNRKKSLGTNFPCAVRLCGAKDAELRKYFSESPQFQSTSNGTKDVFVSALPHFFKGRPDINEARSYLAGWLAGYFAADGCVDTRGEPILSSASRDALEFVRALCYRLGIGTFGIREQTRLGKGSEPSKLFHLAFVAESLPESFFLIKRHRDRFRRGAAARRFQRLRWVVRSVRPTNRSEPVFCAIVPDTHSFVLEDNILTGNCFACSGEGGVIAMIVAARKHESQVGAKSSEHGAMLWLEQALTAQPERILQAQPRPRRAKPHSGALADEHEAGTYDYRNAPGELILRIVRFEGTGRDGSRTKRFEAMRRDSQGGWIHNARGVDIVPYCLPETFKAARAGRVIILVEGERDADVLSSLGLCATSAPFGASFSLPPTWKQYFKGAGALVIIPDADQHGRREAARRAEVLKGAARKTLVCDLWTERDDGYDVSDFVREARANGMADTDIASMLKRRIKAWLTCSPAR